MGIEVGPELPEDADAVGELLRAAFPGESVDEMVAAIRTSAGYEPDLALVARVDDETVGFVAISHAELEDAEGRRDVLTLSPLAVAGQHRRRGIGAVLVRAVLAAADAHRDLPRLVVLEGSPDYYGRLGFVFAPDHGVTIDLPESAPREAAQVFRLSGYDASLRGHLRYPPAFPAH